MVLSTEGTANSLRLRVPGPHGVVGWELIGCSRTFIGYKNRLAAKVGSVTEGGSNYWRVGFGAEVASMNPLAFRGLMIQTTRVGLDEY
jgi:hypothetical protein